MLIFIYGLVFDPATVEPQLQVIARFVPASAFSLISDRVHQLVSQRQGTLGLGLLISTAVALWSSATGTKSLLSALNMAYEEEERAQLPALPVRGLRHDALRDPGRRARHRDPGVPAGGDLVRRPARRTPSSCCGSPSMAVLLVFVLLSLSVLYRFGPSRQHAKWHWVTPGSLLATLLWLAASALFTLYVADLANYDATYGPLGTVVGVMMWFWVTIYAVMLGAELNSELELQTARDSTDGPPKPMGERGAYVADHVAED